MADPRITGELAVSGKQTSLEHGIQAYRGVTQLGLRSRPLASGTIQITAGTADPGVNTVQAFIGTVAISAVVDWITSDDATAEDLAIAINVHAAITTTNNAVAIVSTDTVTVRQRSSGAEDALSATVAGDVTTTDVDYSIDTDTWTEHVGGATFDGDQYYELGFDASLIYDGDLSDAANIMLIDTRLFVDGQAWQYWMNGIRANAAASALVQGLPVATVVWELIEFLGAQATFIIKLAADEELLAKNRYV